MKNNWNGKHVVLDFHGVIADIAQAEIILQGGPPPFVEDIDRYDHPLFSNCWEHLSNPDLYKFMAPIYESQQAVKGLVDSGYFVTIATHQPPGALEYVTNWLANYAIPFDDLVLTENKNRVGGDILVDDRPSNIQRYVAYQGPAVLFGQPWNKDFRFIGRYPALRFVGWNRVLEGIRSLLWDHDYTREGIQK